MHNLFLFSQLSVSGKETNSKPQPIYSLENGSFENLFIATKRKKHAEQLLSQTKQTFRLASLITR